MISAKDRAIHYHEVDAYNETMQWLEQWQQSEACADMRQLFNELYNR